MRSRTGCGLQASIAATVRVVRCDGALLDQGLNLLAHVQGQVVVSTGVLAS